MGGFPPDVPGQPTHADAVRTNIRSFADLGVRFVLTYAGAPEVEGLRIVHRSPLMTIAEVDGAAPYFEAPGCAVEARGREAASVTCEQPAMLMRRELWFPGWRVAVNGEGRALERSGPLFQKVELPAGRSEVAFTYRPPWFGALALLFAAGVAAMLPVTRLRRRAAAWRMADAG